MALKVSDNFDRDDEAPLTTSSSGHTWTSAGSINLGVIKKKVRVTDSYVLVSNYATPQLAANAASGKRLIFPTNQTYTVTSLTIPANCYVEGNGSTLRYPDNSTVDSSHSDEILKINGSGVTIDNLIFDGRVDNQNGIWSQHRHAIRALGNFSNGVIENCQFINLIGDGIYISVGTTGNTGNNWMIRDVSMSGENKNRNGVSIVSGTNITVQDSDFLKMARTGMPGAIDLEPNNATDTLQDIYILNNVVDGGTGGVSGFTSGMLFANIHNADADNIQFIGNQIFGDSLDAGMIIVGKNGGPFNLVTNLLVDNNTIGPLWGPGSHCVELDYWIKCTSISNNAFNTANYAIYNYQACTTGTTITGNSYTNIINGTTIGETTPQCS